MLIVVHDINNWIVTGHLPVGRRGFTIVCLDENYPSHDSESGTALPRNKTKEYDSFLICSARVRS